MEYLRQKELLRLDIQEDFDVPLAQAKREIVGIELGAHVHLRLTVHRGSIALVDAEMILVGAMMRVRDITRVSDD